jgi:hypothetical protein
MCVRMAIGGWMASGFCVESSNPQARMLQSASIIAYAWGKGSAGAEEPTILVASDQAAHHANHEINGLLVVKPLLTHE